MPALEWIGKRAVVKHHESVPYRLLERDPELSHGKPDSSNLIIQGDNLHALKALLPRFAGQVKCIYIDPPYNTGNEGWVYNDNVNSPEIKRWLNDVVGKEGEDLSRHDKWLSMMYPRLLFLCQLLSDDGVIFVSIGDDEIHNMRILMDEVFGRSKRLASFVWRTAGNFDNQAKIKMCHEYILMYSKNPDLFPHPPVIDPSIPKDSKLYRPLIRNTIVKNGPKNPISEVLLPAGFPADLEEGVISARSKGWPKFAADICVEGSQIAEPAVVKSGWSSKNLLDAFIENNFQSILDAKGQPTRFVLTGTGAIESIKEREKPSHVISVLTEFGSTQNTSAELAEANISFPYPKPVDLVEYLISMVDDDSFLVLDSFAGSGTTAHAVLKRNAEDGGSRRFILVEIEEDIASSVTAARVRLASTGYTTPKGVSVAGLGGDFQYCTLSTDPLFDGTGAIQGGVTFAQLAEFVWFLETGAGFPGNANSPLIGVHEGRAIYLLYNGILSDRRINGGNILTAPSLAILPAHRGPKVIYAAACRMGAVRLRREGIAFKQIPYALGH